MILAPGFGVLVNQTEIYDHFSVGPALSWQATAKLSTSLSYNYYLRESDLAGRGYTQNSVTLRASYTF